MKTTELLEMRDSGAGISNLSDHRLVDRINLVGGSKPRALHDGLIDWHVSRRPVHSLLFKPGHLPPHTGTVDMSISCHFPGMTEAK